MKKLLIRKPFYLILFMGAIISIISIIGSCKHGIDIADYTNTGGFVIGRETCNTNDTRRLLACRPYVLSKYTTVWRHIGFRGITYTNVVKVKGLDQRLKKIGMKVSFDFKTVTTIKVETTGCNVTNPITYKLKELFIINQGEIR
ncbi:MAG: hypothetical protein WKF59_22885 [Chitinophagaceae bacterium]